MAGRFIYCVPIMEDRSGTYIYLLRAPNGKIGVARRFI